MAGKTNTPEGDRLEVLASLVEAYERAHFPMDLPDAVEAIRYGKNGAAALTRLYGSGTIPHGF
jgi:antitoxin component HigA of HigAB toxin-antitoxin module